MLEKFFLSCAEGMQSLLSKELLAFNVEIEKKTASGVTVRCKPQKAYELCLWSRIANRVLWHMGTVDASTSDSFYEMAKQINWSEQFSVNETLLIQAHGQNKALRNSHYTALRLKDAVCDQFMMTIGQRPNIDKFKPSVQLHVFIRGGQADIFFDFSGQSLHKRGYRTAQTKTPLKENLAAALLMQCDWPNLAAAQADFVDPLCGSGTLVLEAALMAYDIAPNLLRDRFGFHAWAHFSALAWQDVKTEAIARRATGLKNAQNKLYGFDKQSIPLQAAFSSAEKLGLSQHVSFERQTLQAWQWSTETSGLFLTNPPYGKRLGNDSNIDQLYKTMQKQLLDKPDSWQVGIFTADRAYPKKQMRQADQRYRFYNGALESQLYYYR